MFPLDRIGIRSARARLWRWLVDEVVHAPLEPILHPSSSRLIWVGVFTLMGHAIFGWIWAVAIPQPYENGVVRLGMSLLSLLYLLPTVARNPSAVQSGWIVGLASWVQLPWFFAFMYCMNGGNPVWLGSVAAMILICFHLTDWRLATIGLITGGVLGCLAAEPLTTGAVPWVGSEANWVVLGFALITGLMLGFSSANLRRTRLINTLSTMGVMAHELRTPLATVDLMGDVLRNLAQHDLPDPKRKKLEDLSARLQHLVRSMNRQIDTQISNAQLLRLPRERSTIHAAKLVHAVVSDYPYRSSRERDCVLLTVQADFCFAGSRALFGQVLSNLIKNALHSLASVGTAPQPGDLRIEVGLHRGKGRITVSDAGVGIPYEKQARVFEPFYSTQSGAGSGLGLTFCKNVVESAHGQLSVHSEPANGAVFVIDLPLHSDSAA